MRERREPFVSHTVVYGSTRVLFVALCTK
jgi:hypothetical protein